MRFVSSFLAAQAAVLSLSFCHLAGSSESDVAVARIGQRVVTASELSRRLDALPGFQRRTLGTTPSEVARRYLETVVVPEELLAVEGRRVLTASPRFRARQHAILRDLLVARLAREAEEQEPVTDREVRAYFDQHPELFSRKERIRLQRLLVGTEDEATQLIAKAKELTTMDAWRSFVRKHSLDKATAERGGELGFVAADGSTDVAELEVESCPLRGGQERQGWQPPRKAGEGRPPLRRGVSTRKSPRNPSRTSSTKHQRSDSTYASFESNGSSRLVSSNSVRVSGSSITRSGSKDAIFPSPSSEA
ncbi:MAG: peptidyl-prolyl cis-trans isomerase [Polyangiaceae bacterium]